MAVIDIVNMADAGATLTAMSEIGTSDSIANKQLSCHLLELPAELRTAIFLCMLTHRNPIFVSTELFLRKEAGRHVKQLVTRSISLVTGSPSIGIFDQICPRFDRIRAF